MTITEYFIPGGYLRVDNATGAVAIANSTAITRPARLMSVTVKFSAAPTTSENLTITKDARAGAAYDAVLLTTDPSATSATSILYQPDADLWLEPGDAIATAYTNTDTRTYGLLVTVIETV